MGVDLLQQDGGGVGDAVLLMLPDQVLKALPHRQVAVFFRVPIVVEFVAREDADLACGAFDDTGVLDAVDRNTARTGKVVRDTVVPLAVPVLLEPGNGEPCVRVELTLEARSLRSSGCRRIQERLCSGRIRPYRDRWPIAAYPLGRYWQPEARRSPVAVHVSGRG